MKRVARGSGARNRVTLSGTSKEGSIFLEKFLGNDCKSAFIRRLSYISSLKKHNPCAGEDPCFLVGSGGKAARNRKLDCSCLLWLEAFKFYWKRKWTDKTRGQVFQLTSVSGI
jgi:hypothetical protein